MYMKELSDQLVEVLRWVMMIFLYSVWLPIFLGIIWVVGSVAGEAYFRFGDLHWIIQGLISIGVGLFLKSMITKTYESNNSR